MEGNEWPKIFCRLVDPDKVNPAMIDELTQHWLSPKVDYLLVGGSLVISNHLDEVVQQFKSRCDIPIILFPGSPSQVSPLCRCAIVPVPDFRPQSGIAHRPARDFCAFCKTKRAGDNFYRLYGG